MKSKTNPTLFNQEALTLEQVKSFIKDAKSDISGNSDTSYISSNDETDLKKSVVIHKIFYLQASIKRTKEMLNNCSARTNRFKK